MSEKEFNAKIAGAMQRARAWLLSKYQVNEQDLQDVIQEASLKAMKNLKSFRGKCSFETWFISICRNEINYLFRKNKRQHVYISQDYPLIERDLTWSEPEVIDRSNIEEKMFLVNQAILKLSQKHQDVMALVLENADRSSQDIAELLDIPISSARTRLHYAKRYLKKIIQEDAHQPNIQCVNH